MKIKTNKNIFYFIFGRSPTRFDIAPTGMENQGYVVLWIICLLIVLKFSYMFFLLIEIFLSFETL